MKMSNKMTHHKSHLGKSSRKQLRDRIGRLHLELLKYKHKNFDTDEITGRRGVVLGRFHILRVSTHPRLEFFDNNILLTAWMPVHYAWHHGGPNDPKNLATLEKIKELRGKEYETELLQAEKFMGKHDLLYLRALEDKFTKELKFWKKQ